MQQAYTLRRSERMLQELRALYEGRGFCEFHMNKLEEYAFYIENMDFLTSRDIIVFSGLDGRLMALKPDITMSIVKNAKSAGAGLLKLYYNENVFRASRQVREFRELRQTGVECIGDVTAYTRSEVVWLAARTLAAVDEEFVLDISHSGFIREFYAELGLPRAARDDISRAIAQKSPHDTLRLAEAHGVSPDAAERLAAITRLSGDFTQALELARDIAVNDGMHGALDELGELYALVGDARLRLDFSLISNTEYYSGISFCGYVRRAPEPVLRGGQYDNLLKRMGVDDKRSIGFALYFDALEPYFENDRAVRPETYIVYDQSTLPERVREAVAAAAAGGRRVFADTSVPETAGADIIDLREGI